MQINLRDLIEKSINLLKDLSERPSAREMGQYWSALPDIEEVEEKTAVYKIKPLKWAPRPESEPKQASETDSEAEDLPVFEIPTPRDKPVIAGIDGSSIPLRAMGWIFVGYGVSVAVEDAVATYPGVPGVMPLFDPDIEKLVRPASIASPLLDEHEVSIISNYLFSVPAVGIGEFLCKVGSGKKMSPVIERFCKYSGYAKYNQKTMIDENRMMLENFALFFLSEKYRSPEVALIDGPIASTPGIYQRLSGSGSSLSLNLGSRLALSLYSLSYALNSIIRIILSLNMISQNRVAVGVVKRLEGSRLLMNINNWSIAKSPIAEFGDLAIVDYIIKRYYTQKGSIINPLLVAPLLNIINLYNIFKEIKSTFEDVMGIQKGEFCRTLISYVDPLTINIREDLGWLLSKVLMSSGSKYIGLSDLSSKNIIRALFCESFDLKICKAVGFLFIPSHWRTPAGAVYRIEIPYPCSKISDEDKVMDLLEKAASYVVYDSYKPATHVLTPFPSHIHLPDYYAGRSASLIVREIYTALQPYTVFSVESQEVMGNVLRAG
ncbi:MAG: DNA double-strand break repair nuclease NurA [Desulfurococcales archaeon]|nr:DNA double-strand break repair nuclease NurA [Desulfurococcales archaeon]